MNFYNGPTFHRLCSIDESLKTIAALKRMDFILAKNSSGIKGVGILQILETYEELSLLASSGETPLERKVAKELSKLIRKDLKTARLYINPPRKS